MKEIFFNNVAGFTLSILLKKHQLQFFFKDFQRGSAELHFRIAFRSTPTFREHHPTIASKAKYETAIHNSPKLCSSYEKMKNAFLSMKKSNLYVILPPKPFFKLVSTIFYQIFIFSPNESPSNNIKNVFFNFIEKALFVLEIFHFL